MSLPPTIVPMTNRAFGDTGIELPPLSLGTAALGRPAYLTLGHAQDITDSSVAGMRALTHEVLDASYAAGIRHVDTAHSYGLAETFISEWLETREIADIFLTSKWGYRYVGAWDSTSVPQETKELTLRRFAEQAPISFRRFGARLSGYQIHSATIESGVLSDDGILDAMGALADDGTLIGLSTSGPDQAAAVDAAIALSASGRIPFSFVQSTWNILEPSVGPALRRAAPAGFGVIVKEALANGRLTRGDAVPAHLDTIGARRGVGRDAVCLAAALALDCDPVVLAGPSALDQLTSNLEAVSLDLSREEHASLVTEPIEPHRYWAERSALPWT